MVSPYLLTFKQLTRRLGFVAFLSGTGFLGAQFQRLYMVNRGDLFANEYQMIKDDTNYYHSLHEQVALAYDEKQSNEREKESGILRLRQQLISKATGIVLEVNIGMHRNMEFYDSKKIVKLFGCDWVQSAVNKCELKDSDSTFILADSHKLPFPDE